MAQVQAPKATTWSKSDSASRREPLAATAISHKACSSVATAYAVATRWSWATISASRMRWNS